MDRRRQVLSYSDALAAPSGDVDLEAPLPSLQTSGMSLSSFPQSLRSAHGDGQWSYDMAAWPQAPLHPTYSQPPYRPEPRRLGSSSAPVHQAPPPIYVPPFQQHQHQQQDQPASLSSSYPYSSAIVFPHYSGPPPPLTAPYQPYSPYQMPGTLPYSTANPTHTHASLAASPAHRDWTSRHSSPIVWAPATAPLDYRDHTPATSHSPHWIHSLRKSKKFPAQVSQVVIDDCDASSEEEDRGSGEERALRKSIRNKTTAEIALWRKAQGLSSSVLPPASGKSSPATPNPSSTPGEQMDYERKQAEIRLMIEKIKTLEEAKKRLKQEAMSTVDKAHPHPSKFSSKDGEDSKGKSMHSSEGALVMAALPAEYGGTSFPALNLSVEKDQRDGKSPSSSLSSMKSSAPPHLHIPQSTEQPVSSDLSPSISALATRERSSDLEEGELVEDSGSGTLVLPSKSVRKVILDPQLAEQRRKLLVTMKKKRQSDPGALESVSTLPAGFKRKADDGDNEETSESPADEKLLQRLATAAPAVLVGQNPPFEEISSKRFKRQRKKARRRAVAAVQVEDARQKPGEGRNAGEQTVYESEMTVQATLTPAHPSSSSSMSMSSTFASPPPPQNLSLQGEGPRDQEGTSGSSTWCAPKEVRKGKQRWCPIEAIEGFCSKEGCENRHAL